MLRLRNIADYFHDKYKGRPQILMYPSLNLLTAFVREPVTNLWVVLLCHSKNFNNNRKFVVQNAPDKTTTELILEGVYHHKLDIVPKELNDKALSDFGESHHFVSNVHSNKHTKLDAIETFYQNFQVPKDSDIIPKLTKVCQEFQQLYTHIIKNASKYYKIESVKDLSKKQIQALRKKIYQQYFQR